MSPTQRNFVIGMVVLFGLAATMLAWGLVRTDTEPPGQNNAQKAQQFSPPAYLRALAAPLSPFRPKLKLEQREFAVGAPANVLVVKVPAQADGAGQRFGTFELESGGAAALVYSDSTAGIDASLKSQTVRLSKTTSGSIIAMHDGGQLRLVCLNGPLCVFRLD